MIRKHLLTLAFVAAAPTAAAPAAEPPLSGDVIHGVALLKEAGADVRVDGEWLNAVPEEGALARLAKGSDGFPRIESDNLLDRWDVLAALRARNTELRELLQGADHVLVASTKLDENAEKRLTDQAKISSSALESERRVFALFKVGEENAPGLNYVAEKDTKKRDKLKKNTKVGYAVFVKLPDFRGGKYEAAFAVDKDIRLQKVVIRAPDGSEPADLNQAAARFVGKGARGQYAQLKAGGAGKTVGELEKPLSNAFLMGVESVYMFEVAEREYFAFDN